METKNDYLKELDYINSVDPDELAKNFNNDPECFNSYIKMQSNAAKAAGYPAIAEDMLLAYCH